MLRSLMIIFTVLILGAECCGQNFFWSTGGYGTGAVNADFQTQAQLGDEFTTYLYYDSGGHQNITEGIDLDFSWSTSGVAEFSAAETFDFEINLFMTDRWGDFVGAAQSVTSDSVTGFLAVNVVNGSGIQADATPDTTGFYDFGYDETAEAFLVGAFTAQVVSEGQSEIVIDNSLIADQGVNIEVPFRRFIVSVPEPTSAAVFLFLVLGTMTHLRN